MDYAHRAAHEAHLARAIARMSAGQRRLLFKIMGEPPKLENVPPEYWGGHFAAWQGVLTPELEDIFIDSAKLMLEDNIAIGVDWDLVNEDAANWARQHGARIVRDITNNTERGVQAALTDYWDEAQGAVAEFYDEALNLRQLRKKLERWYSPSRADMIATTEVTRASVEGERAVVAEAEKIGFEMVEIWQTNDDEIVCTICGPRDGKPEGSNWTKADGPPAHPRCRCWTTHEFVQPETQ